jgi:23S rRNA (adenine2503-C2)-methyltransferase
MHVNLIPLNPTPGFGVPASPRVGQFASALRSLGVNVTIRDTRGREIDAACGQLAVTTRKARSVRQAGRPDATARRG